jgi:hypothetical protein
MRAFESTTIARSRSVRGQRANAFDRRPRRIDHRTASIAALEIGAAPHAPEVRGASIRQSPSRRRRERNPTQRRRR